MKYVGPQPGFLLETMDWNQAALPPALTTYYPLGKEPQRAIIPKHTSGFRDDTTSHSRVLCQATLRPSNWLFGDAHITGDRDPKIVVYNDGLRIWGNCKAVRWEGIRREKEGERRKQNKLVKTCIQDEPPAKIPRHSKKTSWKEQQPANPPCARRIHSR